MSGGIRTLRHHLTARARLTAPTSSEHPAPPSVNHTHNNDRALTPAPPHAIIATSGASRLPSCAVAASDQELGSGRVIAGVDVTARVFSFVLSVERRTLQSIRHEQSRRYAGRVSRCEQALTADNLSASYIRRTSLAIGARRQYHPQHTPQLSPVSPEGRQSFTTSFLSRTRPQDPELGTAQSHGTGHVSFRQSFGTSTARPAPVDYTDSPLGTPPLHRQGTHNTHEDSGFGFSVSSGDSDMLRRPRRRSSLTGPKYKWLSNNTGDEPGVDVRSERDEEMYKHLRGKANVTVS